MTGLIVAGHNGFAKGMLEAGRLLTGDYPHMAEVDFYPHESEETLNQKLQQAMDSMEECHKVFVLCDILGGSPFKNAASLWYGNEKVIILYGVNLSILVELSMNMIMEQDELTAEELISIGQKQIGCLQ